MNARILIRKKNKRFLLDLHFVDVWSRNARTEHTQNILQDPSIWIV